MGTGFSTGCDVEIDDTTRTVGDASSGSIRETIVTTETPPQYPFIMHSVASVSNVAPVIQHQVSTVNQYALLPPPAPLMIPAIPLYEMPNDELELLCDKSWETRTAAKIELEVFKFLKCS